MTAQQGPTSARHRWGAARVTTVTAAALALIGVAVLALRSGNAETRADRTPPAAPVVATRSPLPAALVVSTRSVHVEQPSTTTSFGIANTGDLPLIYQVSTRTPWIRAPGIGGSLGGGSGHRIDLLVDPSAGAEGEATGTVVLSWDGGPDVVVHVHMDGAAPVSPSSSTRPRPEPGSR